MANAKEFFPLNYWDTVENLLLDPAPLQEHFTVFDTLRKRDTERYREFYAVLDKAGSETCRSCTWQEVDDPINSEHRVRVLFRLDAPSRKLEFSLDISRGQIGIEKVITGMTTGSPPFSTTFTPIKLPPKHPLYFTSDKEVRGRVAILKVLRPPLKWPDYNEARALGEPKSFLLAHLRCIPFNLLTPFLEALGKFRSALSQDLIPCVDAFSAMLRYQTELPQHVAKLVSQQLDGISKRRDHETELAFWLSLYQRFKAREDHLFQPSYFANIDTLLKQMLSEALKGVLALLDRQQKEIQLSLHSHKQVEQDKERLRSMRTEIDQLKKRDASPEVQLRARQDFSKLAEKVKQILRSFQVHLGILLIQELYLGRIQEIPELQPSLETLQREIHGLTRSMAANHKSAVRELQQLCKRLGKHGERLLLQGTILSDIDDAGEPIGLDQVGVFDSKNLGSVLVLAPSLTLHLNPDHFTSTELLRSVIDHPLDVEEQQRLSEYMRRNPRPRNRETYRFISQLDNFVALSKKGRGHDLIFGYLKRELDRLKSIIDSAVQQNKLNTDFKNHVAYYLKLYVDPHHDFLKSLNYPGLSALEVPYQRMRNSLNANFKIQYSSEEEKSLMTMFRHIFVQLQNRDLFTIDEFSKQLSSFLTLLKGHRGIISTDLTKRILTSYTVFMMGCSRTMNLSREGGGSLTQNLIDEIRDQRRQL